MLAIAALALGLAASVSAVQVVSPTNTSVWSSGTLSQTIEWTAVSTDQQYFTVQLINQNGYLTNSPVTLIANQSSGSADIINQATVTYPGGSWPTGTLFQINLVASNQANAAILAQSPQFNITYSASSTTSSSSSSSSSSSKAATPTTITGLTSSASSTGTVLTVTSANATADIPNAVSTSKSAAAPAVVLSSSLLAVVGAAGVAKLLL